MAKNKQLTDKQVKQTHEELKTKGKILGQKFLDRNSISGDVLEEQMYNLIKSESASNFFKTLNQEESELSESEMLEITNEMLGRK